MPRDSLKYFILLLFLINSIVTQAQHWVYRDSTGVSQINEVIRHPEYFKKRNTRDLGLDNVWFWIKIPIKNLQTTEQQKFAVLENPYLDLAHAYFIIDQKIIQDFGPQNYASPISQRPFKHHSFVFPLKIPPHTETFLYIKIHRHFLKVSAPIFIYDLETFYERIADKNMIYSVFSGFIITLIVFALVVFAINLERYFIFYAAYLICLLGSVLLIEGYCLAYFQKINALFSLYNWRNAFNNLAVLFLILFIKSFILKGAEKDTHIRKAYFIALLAIGIPLTILMLEKPFYENQWQQPYLLKWLPHSGYILAILLSFYMVIYSLYKSIQPFIAKAFLIGILPVFLYTILSLFRNISLLPDGEWLSYKVRLFCMLFDALVLFIGIAIQIKMLRDEKDKQAKLALQGQIKLLEEKERISQDLHDYVGSQLTVVSTGLDNAHYLAKTQKLNPEKLEKLNENVRDAVQSLRDSIWAVSNETLTLQDFINKVKSYLAKSLPDHISLGFEVTGNKDLILEAEKALMCFRAVQEVTSNTIKHAEATQIKFTIKEVDEAMKIKISDNGKGFDTKQISPLEEHYGLKNLEARIHKIGGRFSLESALGTGTKITIEIS